MENFESIGCALRARKLCGAAHWEATYARGRKCENALELRGRAPADFPDQAFARESTLDKETALWARWGAHRARGEARRQRCGVAGRCDVHRGGDVRAVPQAAGVCSQHAWCGGEGDCASKRAGSSAEEARICVEERAFRAR